MRGVIIAGGFGTRLRPLTLRRPKPLIPLANRPFLEYQVAQLRAAGVEEIVFATNYLADRIEAHFGTGSRFGVRMRYAMEQEPLGTAGAIRNAVEGLPPMRCIVFNGDILTDIDLGAVVRHHLERGAQATLTLYRVQRPHPYGIIQVAADGCVQAFIEPSEEQKRAAETGTGFAPPPAGSPRGRGEPNSGAPYRQGEPRRGEPNSGAPGLQGEPNGGGSPNPSRSESADMVDEGDFINAGIYVLEPELIAHIPLRPCSIEREFYPQILREGVPVYGYVGQGFWLDIGRPAQYMRATRALLKGEVHPVLAPPGTRTPDGYWLMHEAELEPDAEIEPGCHIGASACIEARVRLSGYTVVGAGSTVGSGSRLHGCILGAHVRIGDGCQLEDCILDDEVVVESHARLKGVVLGAGSLIRAYSTM